MWDWSEETFAERVQSWRATRAIRTDDTTLMILPVSTSMLNPEPTPEPTDGIAD
jgi:hypothetical protein